ncbi:MAG: hypothetical protein Q9203_001223 [Teloschistes exilis]
MSDPAVETAPEPGEWPVDPQQGIEISKARIWIDGCFDFSHHGHAGAMLQARRLGKELLVGVHSDQEILENKGPTVMTLEERVSAVDACRWSTRSIPHAPYVTSLPWISHYGCHYVVHGDDITSDSGGEDCYRFVKNAGRFLVVKRTSGISTTDLFLSGNEGPGSPEERSNAGMEMSQRIKDYASDETGRQPGALVYSWDESNSSGQTNSTAIPGSCKILVDGVHPQPGQRLVYVDGGFDLFSSGHIEFLRQVIKAEEALGRSRGCCVVFSAPFTPSKTYLNNLPFGTPHAVYHGPTAFMPLTYDPYAAAKDLGIYRQIGNHDFQHVNAGEIVQRILRSRQLYEERQEKKGEKGAGEEAVRRREQMEEDAAMLEKERAVNR